MSDPLDALEKRINELRRAIRDASAASDAERASELRAQLRRTERAWDALLDTEPATTPMPAEPAREAISQGAMLPAREHAHRALMLLRTPAAPKLIVDVHRSFFPGELSASKLSSLRRDEERSYRASPGARPYYLCPALTHDLLSPARALVTINTWPLEQRIVGPLSPRVDFLTNAVHIADAVRTAGEDASPNPAAQRLLWRLAVNIPGATQTDAAPHAGGPDPARVIDAAEAELLIHADADRLARVESARRARKRLSDEQQLFGAALHEIRRSQPQA